VRVLARLSGLSGNRESGLALLAEAATPGAETQSDADLLLMIIDHREGRHADGVRRLDRLRRKHTRNRLLWLNQAASALAADRPAVAEQLLSEGLRRHSLTAEPAVTGEAALWFAHRGTALARLRRTTEAEADLRQGLAAGPRDWVRGRIHARLGDLSLVSGDAVLARREYDEAMVFAQRGGDGDAIAELKQKVRALAASRPSGDRSR
jgi:tetratricopeptide (TPR) repeat protein